MSRALGWLTVLGLIVLAWLGLSHYRKSYELLPANLPSKVAMTPVSPMKEWRKYTPKNARFTVLMPVLPQHATENQKERHYEMYVSEENNGTLYMISMIEFKVRVEPKHQEMVLNSIMEDLLNTNPANELVSSSSGLFEGKKSLEFNIKNSEIVINGKAFMDEQTLFVLTRISKREFENKTEFNNFIQSFHLLPVKIQKNGVLK